MPDPLKGYSREPFPAEGKTRNVYPSGRGPAVIVISEVPGMTPLVADFGRRATAAGCTAVLPHLFGRPGKPPSAGYEAQVVAWICISRSSPTSPGERPVR